MAYSVELTSHASYLEAFVAGDFGGIAEAVRMYDGIGRVCAERGVLSLLIVRDHTIAPNPEEGRLLMSELTRIDSLAPLKIAYVVPHATPRLIELVEMANAYKRPLWRVFAKRADAVAYLVDPQSVADGVLKATGANLDLIEKKRD